MFVEGKTFNMVCTDKSRIDLSRLIAAKPIAAKPIKAESSSKVIKHSPETPKKPSGGGPKRKRVEPSLHKKVR